MWLLEAHVRQMIENAEANGTTPTLDEQIKFETRYSAQDEDGSPRILKTAGSVGEISIRGIMTKAPSFMAMLFGGGNTTYSEIVSAIAVAEQDDSVKELVFAIDSPGGQFDGLFEVLAAMQAAKKPSRTLVQGTAASAAFAIAVQTDKVEAVNRASRLGSVGVVATVRVDESSVNITSTDAPDKRPDVTTEAGRSVVRVELDAMHELFAESIAEGRGTTVEKVNAEFGQGATLLADEAIKRGMIDGIAGASLSVVRTPKTDVAASASTQREEKAMTLDELKTSDPATYAAAVAIGNGEGVTQERERVKSFLIAGDQSGDMKTAVESIQTGAEMTMSLTTQFMMAAANRGNVETRTADEIEAAAALDEADKGDVEAKDLAASTNLTKLAAELCGVELKEV